MAGNGVAVYDIGSGQRIVRWFAPGGDFGVDEASVSPDNSHLAMAGTDSSSGAVKFQLYDIQAAKMVSVWNGGTGNLFGDLAYSPDGRWIAWQMSAALNIKASSVYVADGKTGKIRKTLQQGFSALTFSQDGRFLADAREDGTIQLWNAESGVLLASLSGHEAQGVQGIQFSPDGARLVSYGNFDNTVRLWGIPAANVVVARAGINVVQKDIRLSNFADLVPATWLPQGAKPARYELDLAWSDTVVASCPYTGGHTLNLKSYNLAATLTDLQTNRVVAQKVFYGKYASVVCPSTYSFSHSTDEEYIGNPDVTEFSAWLNTTMTPLGFTAPTPTPSR